jgi:phosphoribosylglycinamide formyltransferase-1
MILTEEGVVKCGKGEEKRGEYRVAVLASGRGSDFQSLIDAKESGKLHANLVGLITDNPEAGAIERAKKEGIPVHIIRWEEREELDRGVLKKLDELAPDLVVLAGYMKIIRNKELLLRYSGRIINIHPSLLPKYPGAHAQKDAFDAGEKVSGFTIHYVDESLDGGKIIYQEKVSIEGAKNEDDAALAILEREHVGLPMIVEKFAKGEIKQKS